MAHRPDRRLLQARDRDPTSARGYAFLHVERRASTRTAEANDHRYHQETTAAQGPRGTRCHPRRSTFTKIAPASAAPRLRKTASTPPDIATTNVGRHPEVRPQPAHWEIAMPDAALNSRNVRALNSPVAGNFRLCSKRLIAARVSPPMMPSVSHRNRASPNARCAERTGPGCRHRHWLAEWGPRRPCGSYRR